MLNLRETISFLYPKSTADAVRTLIDRVESGVILDFHEPELQRLQIKDLSNSVVQERFIQTLVELSKGGEVGPVLAIMDQLELQSAGTIDFEELGRENRTFYLRYYAVAGALAFEELGDVRQQFLFGTFFLPLMVSYESHLYTDHIQRYFAKFCYVRLLEEARDNLVGALEQNTASIGVGELAKTIAWWISDFKNTKADTNDPVGGYFKEDKKFEGMDVFTKIVLQQILFIYHKVATGEVWKELTYHLCTHATEKELHSFNFEDFYLDRLKNSRDVATWLENYEEALPWLEKRNDVFIKKLFAVLQQKIDLDAHQEQAMQLLTLVHQLPPAWRERYESMVVFDETKQKFVWNSVGSS